MKVLILSLLLLSTTPSWVHADEVVRTEQEICKNVCDSHIRNTSQAIEDQHKLAVDYWKEKIEKLPKNCVALWNKAYLAYCSKEQKLADEYEGNIARLDARKEEDLAKAKTSGPACNEECNTKKSLNACRDLCKQVWDGQYEDILRNLIEFNGDFDQEDEAFAADKSCKGGDSCYDDCGRVYRSLVGLPTYMQSYCPQVQLEDDSTSQVVTGKADMGTLSNISGPITLTVAGQPSTAPAPNPSGAPMP